MLWRAQNDKKIPIDMSGLYNGSVALIGGSPCLRKLNLRTLPIPSLCVNNAVSVVPEPTFSIFSDSPECFYSHVLYHKKTIKFVNICRFFTKVNEGYWRDISGVLFYPIRTEFTPKNFLDWWKGFAFAKDIMGPSIGILYYLGFRKIYTIGCRFKQSTDDYAWNVKLTAEQREWNKRTYRHGANKIISWKPTFESHGLTIVSCTEDSLLNGPFEYLPYDEMVRKETSVIDTTVKVKHSSEIAKAKEVVSVKPVDYLEIYKKAFSNSSYSKVSRTKVSIDELLKFLELQKFETIADVGAGRGLAGQIIKEKQTDCKVISMDLADFRSNENKAFSDFLPVNLTTSPNIPQVDGLLCMDVLEHIEEKYIPLVLQTFIGKAKRYLFTMATNSDVIDGVELHLTQRPFNYWKALLEHHFTIEYVSTAYDGKLLIFRCEPLKVQEEKETL